MQFYNKKIPIELEIDHANDLTIKFYDEQMTMLRDFLNEKKQILFFGENSWTLVSTDNVRFYSQDGMTLKELENGRT